MKKRVLAFRGRTHAGGMYIEAGVPIAVIESEVPWDSILAGLAAGNVIEIESAPLPEGYLVAAEPEPAGDPPVSPAGEGGDEAEPSEPAAEAVQSEPEQTETLLKDCGLTHSLADRLAANGITTLEQLTEFLAGNGELSELEGVTAASAKRIAAWFKGRTK